ncbi:Capsular polysaccharide biosynthesis protein [Seinonella peptonophila]|uniref:Capsular polysaccharide biosynthesis protein n=1 Tax=Seinonella peptonophila TaxID=112248 RepID=A0A1M5AE34_9BACL|nr:Wzz/FepE/Etk N-terminal domain-containing protein [Seinonella peptonophila]SHF28356.1 Capsular polysaccharide biosynthesis protein [Seinonella peptonophila]
MNKKIFSLIYFYKCFVRYLPLILLITLSTTIISGAVCFFVTPKYKAETELMVNMKEISYGDVEANLNLIQTYNSIIKSAYIMEPVAKSLQLEEDVPELAEHVYVHSENNASQVFSIVVEDTDHEKAVLMANTISYVFQSKIKYVLNVQNVHILTKANIGDYPPVKPNKYIYLAIGFTLGFILSLMIVLWLEVRRPSSLLKKLIENLQTERR